MSYSGYDGGQGGGYEGGYSSYGGYSEANYPHTPQQREGSHTPHSFYDPNQYTAPAPQQHQGGGYGGHPGQHGGHLPPGGQHGAYPNGAANQAPSQFNNPSQFLQENFNLNPMMTGMAEDYTRKIADEGMAKAKTTVEKYVSIGQLKYYFAVDNSYVTRKLSLILFPFFHKDWSIRYNQDEPVQPRYELNAADLYIPIMAFLTYILVVGYVLGLSSRFSPEVLATTASSSLVWLILEIMVIYLTTTIMSIKTTLAKWDFLAFSMYKYVGMIVSMVAGLLLSTKGYYSALLYSMIALVLFLFRTLHLRVEPEVHGVENHGKRKMWLLFLVAGLQPLLMWWLTYSLVPEPVVIPGPQM